VSFIIRCLKRFYCPRPETFLKRSPRGRPNKYTPTTPFRNWPTAHTTAPISQRSRPQHPITKATRFMSWRFCTVGPKEIPEGAPFSAAFHPRYLKLSVGPLMQCCTTTRPCLQYHSFTPTRPNHLPFWASTNFPTRPFPTTAQRTQLFNPRPASRLFVQPGVHMAPCYLRLLSETLVHPSVFDLQRVP